FFRSPELALATLVRIAEAERAALPQERDPFYIRTDLSLDSYRSIRGFQREQLESQTYVRAVTAFRLGLLRVTGSRVSRGAGALGERAPQPRAGPARRGWRGGRRAARGDAARDRVAPGAASRADAAHDAARDPTPRLRPLERRQPRGRARDGSVAAGRRGAGA